MSVEVVRITPGAGRAGDTIEVEGSGFGTEVHRLAVTLGGTPVSIADLTDEGFALVVPAGLTAGQFSDLVVTLTPEDGDPESVTHRWWVKATAAALQTYRIPLFIYGPIEKAETASVEHGHIAQAKDFERATQLAELLPFDVLTTKGAMAVRQVAGGPVRVAVGANGTRFVRDATSGSWRTREVQTHTWGRLLAAADTGEVMLCANGPDTLTTSQGENNVAPVACRVALVSIACRRASPNTQSVTRVRIFVNGSASFDTDTLDVFDRPDVRQGESWWWAPWLSLSAGDRVSVGLTKASGSADLNMFARILTV